LILSTPCKSSIINLDDIKQSRKPWNEEQVAGVNINELDEIILIATPGKHIIIFEYSKTYEWSHYWISIQNQK